MGCGNQCGHFLCGNRLGQRTTVVSLLDAVLLLRQPKATVAFRVTVDDAVLAAGEFTANEVFFFFFLNMCCC